MKNSYDDNIDYIFNCIWAIYSLVTATRDVKLRDEEVE